jgi:hypothetical protein
MFYKAKVAVCSESHIKHVNSMAETLTTVYLDYHLQPGHAGDSYTRTQRDGKPEH